MELTVAEALSACSRLHPEQALAVVNVLYLFANSAAAVINIQSTGLTSELGPSLSSVA